MRRKTETTPKRAMARSRIHALALAYVMEIQQRRYDAKIGQNQRKRRS